MAILFLVLEVLLLLAVMPGIMYLLFLTLGSLAYRSPRKVATGSFPLKVCILVPAHDEEECIEYCVQSLLSCKSGEHQYSVVVVADNCTDHTRERAESAGARVLVRNDEEFRGKGYALQYAFSTLLCEDHDIFLIVDADSVVDRNFVEEMSALFVGGADAVQCKYLVNNAGDSIRARLMSVASLAFNVVRPLGREYWGISVGILGSGFGLSRKALEKVPFEAGSIVEDLEYHLRLLKMGLRVHYCEATAVWAAAPSQGKVAAGQCARWDGGRLLMIREQVPRLAREVLKGHLTSLDPLLDLLLLPLAFHVSLLLFLTLFPLPFVQFLALLGIAVVVLHISVALRVERADWRDAAALLYAPFYMIWKLALGMRIFRMARRGAVWQRTERFKKDAG